MGALLMGLFCGDNHSFDFTPTDVPNINNIQISNGLFDEIYASKNGLIEFNENKKDWDFDTVLYALFHNNLFGGNVEFTSNTVSSIRVKRRKKGDFVWDTLFQIQINNNDDFSFERFDRYARAFIDYEYSLVPVINNVEGNINVNNIKPEFDGMYLIEKDVVYQALLNAKIPSTERNQDTAIVKTLGRKKPFVISNGDANYTSGTLEATFIDVDLNCHFDIENGWKYREQVDDYLTNKKIKILKNDEGKMWLVSIVNSIQHDYSQHYQMPIHSISWVEVGDCESVVDLYNANMIDVDPRLVGR